MTESAGRREPTAAADDVWTFDRLLTPLTKPEFVRMLAARTPGLLPASAGDRWSSLLSWGTVRQLFEASAIPADSLMVTRDGVQVPRVFYCVDDRIQPKRLFELLDRGYSMVVRYFEKSFAPLAGLAAEMQMVLGERVRISLVSTTGAGGALPRHFDHGDVLALQLAGAKRWRIYDDPVTDPVVAGPSVERTDKGVVELDTVLHPGSRLFVPAGYWHHCDNTEGRSLHLSVVLNPPCAQNVLAAIARAMVADPEWRRPGDRVLDPAARVVSREALKAMVLRRLNDMPAESMFALYLADPERLRSY